MKIYKVLKTAYKGCGEAFGHLDNNNVITELHYIDQMLNYDDGDIDRGTEDLLPTTKGLAKIEVFAREHLNWLRGVCSRHQFIVE